MAHGKHAARDLRYGRRGGRWAEPPQPPMSELRAAHVADPPPRCTCVWCTEAAPAGDESPSLFDTEETTDA